MRSAFLERKCIDYTQFLERIKESRVIAASNPEETRNSEFAGNGLPMTGTVVPISYADAIIRR